MNLIDIAVLALFAYFMLSGCYRGFMNTLLSLGAYIIATVLALLCTPLAANWIKSNQEIYNMALFYTEGAGYVGDAALAHSPVTALSSAQLTTVLDNAELPIPMADRIAENVARESFANDGLISLGEYFNQTIVNVFINIVSLLLLFCIIRALLAFVIQLVDYAKRGYPALHGVDGLVGGGLGLVRGFLAMYTFFLITPAMLIVLPIASEYVDGSFFGSFFYTSNFLLRLVAG